MKRSISVVLCLMLVVCLFLIPTEASAYQKTGNQAEDIVEYAKTQIGIKQSGACAWFITKCAKEAGLTGDQMKLSATAASPYNDGPGQFDFISAKDKTGNFKYGCQVYTWKDFKNGTYQPKKGDLVFFGKINVNGTNTGTANLSIKEIVKNYYGKWSHKHVAMIINDSSTTSKLYTINGGWDSSKGNKSVGTYNYGVNADSGKLTSTSVLGGTYWVMEFVRPDYRNVNISSDAVANSMTYNGRVYERYDYNLTWTDAKAFCEAKGGHLVTITDAAEQNAVVGLLSDCPFGFYHIGLYKENSSWKWVTQEGFSYYNWDTQKQEGDTPGENYAAIMGKDYGSNKQVGEWIDQSNGSTSDTGFYAISNGGFICEYEARPAVPTVTVGQSAYTVGNTVRIGWNGVDNADRYYIRIYKDNSLFYQAQLASSARSYDMTNAQAGSYKVQITAGNSSGESDPGIVQFNVNVPFDLNGRLDGAHRDDLNGFGLADVYINGTLVAKDCTDYYAAWPVGTTYEVKNIRALDGYRYDGPYSAESRSLTGTIGGGSPYWKVILSFSTLHTFTFDPNGGTGTMSPIQTAINDSVVLPYCSFTKEKAVFGGWMAYRPADNKYAISDVGWRTVDEMAAAGLMPTIYPAQLSFTMNTTWTEGTTGPCTIVLFPYWYKADFVLPQSLTVIDEGAFSGGAFSYLWVPEGVSTIRSGAFTGCNNLWLVEFNSASVNIAAGAFDRSSDLVFLAPAGGSVQAYAQNNNITFYAK